jgi:antirestriction protein ArdC
MKQDNRAIFTAASHAQRAVDTCTAASRRRKPRSPEGGLPA